MRLLLVTAHTSDQQSVLQVLQDTSNCDVVCPTENVDTLELLCAGEPFDAIYFDVPDDKGFELFTQIIQQSFHIPLLFVTDTGQESLAAQALAIGAADYLIKDANNGHLTLLPAILRRLGEIRENVSRPVNGVSRQWIDNYQATIDAMNDSIHVVDTDLKIILINKTFKQWNKAFGLETDVVGKTIFEVFPFLSDKVRDEYRWVIESQRTLTTTEQYPVGDQLIYTETKKLPIIELGNVNRIVTIVHDITEYLQTGESLPKRRHTSPKRRQIAQIGSWETDLITGKTNWSQEMDRIVGIHPADFDHDIQRIIKKTVHPDDLEFVINTPLQTIGDAIRKDPAIEDASVAFPPIEFRLIPPDGVQKTVSTEGSVIFRAGHPVKLIGTMQDITERKYVEAEMMQQTAQLEALRQLGLEITAQLDLDTLLHSVVSRAMELVGGSSGGLYLYMPDRNVIQLAMCVGPDLPSPGEELHCGEGLAGRVWEMGQSLIVDNYQQWEDKAAVFTDLSWTAVVGVPIRWGAAGNDEEFLGVLDILARPPHSFSTSDIDLLDMFATQAAIAIRNARLYEETRRRNLEQETVSQIARALNTLDVEDALPVLVEGLQTITACDRVSMALADESKELFTMFVLDTNVAALTEGSKMPISQTSAGQDILTGLPHLTPNLAKEKDLPGEQILFQAGFRSRINLPLLVGSEVIGSLNLGSREVEKFHPNQLSVLQQIADAVASAVRNSQVFKIEQRKREEADTLRQAALALTTALHRQDVIERILAQLQQVVPYDTCSVQLYHQQGEAGQAKLQIVGGRGFPNISEIMALEFIVGGDNPNTDVVRSRATLVVDDAPAVYKDFQTEPHIHAGIRSWLGVPMLIGNRLIGMIALDRSEPSFYTQEHAQLAEVFAAQAAVAIENARLYEEAQQQAEMMSVLLNEVNHRVKNNLTGIIGLLYLARNRAKVTDQDSYQVTMDELIGRARGLASVHTMLSESEWRPLQLTQMAYEIIHAALRAQPYGKQISVEIPPTDIWVTADQAHNLALVINELATNTLKYAVADRNSVQIVFQTELNDRMIRCEFRDNGPGYPADVLELKHHSIGFDLIRNIVQSNLRGNFFLRNAGGAVTAIEFKAEV